MAKIIAIVPRAQVFHLSLGRVSYIVAKCSVQCCLNPVTSESKEVQANSRLDIVKIDVSA